jgi:hypothetical protein
MIADKYVKHRWMIAATYNGLIEAFGKDFENFSFQQLADFNNSLAKVGLRQVDIVSETINRLIDSFSQKTKTEDDERPEPYQVSFGKVIVPLFESIAKLNLQDENALVSKLTDDEFIKRAVFGHLTFSEQAMRSSINHQSFLLAILESGLYAKDAKFKDLVSLNNNLILIAYRLRN